MIRRRVYRICISRRYCNGINDTLRGVTVYCCDDPAIFRVCCIYSRDSDSNSRQVERDERVNLLLMTMGLDKCKDNFIGSTGTAAQNSGIKRGISGGERKRVSICIELVNNPSEYI